MILKTINSTENHTIRDAGNKIVETLLPQIQLIKDQSALESLGKMIVNSLKAITSTLAQVPEKANIRTVATNSTSGSWYYYLLTYFSWYVSTFGFFNFIKLSQFADQIIKHAINLNPSL